MDGQQAASQTKRQKGQIEDGRNGDRGGGGGGGGENGRNGGGGGSERGRVTLGYRLPCHSSRRRFGNFFNKHRDMLKPACNSKGLEGPRGARVRTVTCTCTLKHGQHRKIAKGSGGLERGDNRGWTQAGQTETRTDGQTDRTDRQKKGEQMLAGSCGRCKCSDRKR